MKVEILQETFIPPNKYAEGSIIEYLGPWGPQFKPLDDEARAAEAEYFQRRPDATLDPTKDLPMTTGEDRREIVRPQASIIRAPTTIGTDAQNSTNPGLATESGDPADFGKMLLEKIGSDPNFAATLAQVIAQHQSASGTAVVTPDLEPAGDLPGRGAGAETISQEEAAEEAKDRAKSAPEPREEPKTGSAKAADDANAASAKASEKNNPLLKK